MFPVPCRIIATSSAIESVLVLICSIARVVAWQPEGRCPRFSCSRKLRMILNTRYDNFAAICGFWYFVVHCLVRLFSALGSATPSPTLAYAVPDHERFGTVSSWCVSNLRFVPSIERDNCDRRRLLHGVHGGSEAVQ